MYVCLHVFSVVLELHREFVHSGAEVLQACTFWASEERLSGQVREPPWRKAVMCWPILIKFTGVRLHVYKVIENVGDPTKKVRRTL